VVGVFFGEKRKGKEKKKGKAGFSSLFFVDL
jgi:hypothetical protein